MKDDPYKKSDKKYDSFVEPFNRALRKIGMKLYPPVAGIKVFRCRMWDWNDLKPIPKSGL